MGERIFSRKCGKCRQRAVELATVPYETHVEFDGRNYLVSLPALSVPRCGNCGDISIDEGADQQISDAFRRVAQLLSPEQIKEGRQQLGLTEQKLADLLGVAVSTLAQWESGGRVQQRPLDGLLRAIFDLPELRRYLGRLRGWSAEGATAGVAPAAREPEEVAGQPTLLSLLAIAGTVDDLPGDMALHSTPSAPTRSGR